MLIDCKISKYVFYLQILTTKYSHIPLKKHSIDTRNPKCRDITGNFIGKAGRDHPKGTNPNTQQQKC